MIQIGLPNSVTIEKGTKGPVLKGPALALRKLSSELRFLSEAPAGLVCYVGDIELYVSIDPNDPHGTGRVSLPHDAWNILASKFIEVTAGLEESPFYFGDCGYLWPPPTIDLGIELLGEPAFD